MTSRLHISNAKINMHEEVKISHVLVQYKYNRGRKFCYIESNVNVDLLGLMKIQTHTKCVFELIHNENKIMVESYKS